MMYFYTNYIFVPCSAQTLLLGADLVRDWITSISLHDKYQYYPTSYSLLRWQCRRTRRAPQLCTRSLSVTHVLFLTWLRFSVFCRFYDDTALHVWVSLISSFHHFIISSYCLHVLGSLTLSVTSVLISCWQESRVHRS